MITAFLLVANFSLAASISMLNMIACRNNDDRYFNGYKVLSAAKAYHSEARNNDVAEEIYGELCSGKIVIIDLSVGNAMLREKISKKIAAYVFNRSMDIFTQGKMPSNIVFYIEEAHNLIGKNNEITDTWPRIAKEGAKYHISLVYATQEVSSVHPNILANTENWFVSHLNSEKEIRELAKFYDFADFSKSLLRSQDVGFTRVVIPDEDGVATSEMIPLCPMTNQLNRAYLCYWLRSNAFVKHISEKVVGAKMPRVSMDYFRSMTIELPPMELQEQFAAFVEQTDKSKLAIQKSLEELETLKESLMQKYFG